MGKRFVEGGLSEDVSVRLSRDEDGRILDLCVGGNVVLGINDDGGIVLYEVSEEVFEHLTQGLGGESAYPHVETEHGDTVVVP